MSDQRVDIPNHANWPTNTLDDLCEVISRGKGPRYVESSSVSAVGQRCITDTGFDAGFSRPHDEKAMSGHLVPVSGDVLLNSTGTGTIGRSSVFDGHGRFVVDSHVTVLRPRKREADPKWLNELLRNPRIQRHLEANCYTGSTNQLELSRSQLMKSAVPTPTYDEQRLIACILDTLDTQIQKTEALVAKLEKVKEGLLHDLLTRGIDESGRLRPSPEQAPELYKESPLGLIPREWDALSIGQLTVLVTSGSRGWAEYYSDSGDLFIRSQNVRMGRIDLTDQQYVTPPSDGEGQRTSVKPCDLLVTITGNSVGNIANLSEEWSREAFVSQHVGLIRFHQPELSKFSEIFLVKGAPGNRQLLDAQYGQSKPGLSLDNLRSLVIPVPPQYERDELVGKVESIQARILAEKASLIKLITQKLGLIDDLLTGRVRVTPLLEQAEATTPA